jgi:uncharacterized membrane protein YbhN (UPF0104 family)
VSVSEPSTTPRPRRRDRTLRLAAIGISIASVAAVAWWAAHQPAPKLPSSASALATVAGAIAVYMVGMTLRAERWYWLLRHVDAQPSRSDTFRLIFVGYMGNTVIPARGGDAMRVYLGAPRAKAGARQVIGTLFAERILDVAVLASLLAVLAFVVLRGIDLPIGGSSWLLLAGGLALATVAVLVLYLARHRSRVSRILRFVEPMTVATRELRGRFGVEMAALSLLIWSIEATTYLITSRAVGLDLQPSQALYLVSLASAFALIPSGPGYAGTLDAGIIFGVHAIGGSNRTALSYLVTLRFVLLAPITLLGLAFLLTRYGGWSRLRHPREQGSEA